MVMAFGLKKVTQKNQTGNYLYCVLVYSIHQCQKIVIELLKMCPAHRRDEMVDKKIQEELAFQETWLLWNTFICLSFICCTW